MNYSLIVVDMQPQFSSSQNEVTLNRVEELVKKAVEDNAGIVFLEFYGYGKTNSRLLNIVKGYENSHICIKKENNGAKQVHESIIHYNLPYHTFKVCGVNTNYCVRQTVEGLVEEYPHITRKIEVSMNGTNCNSDHLFGLSRIKEVEKVELID